MVTVAGCSVERRWIAAHVSASGLQLRAASSGISLGRWFVAATARGSISPIRTRSPRVFTRIPANPSLNATSIRRSTAIPTVSRQRKTGGVISGGKSDRSSG